MLKKRKLLSIVTLLFVQLNISFAVEAKSFACGVSDGYPPYQFKDSSGEATGFDIDVLRLVFQKAEQEIVFRQMNWDDVVGLLGFTKELDCAAGMEISEIRKTRFDFTSPYYYRKIAIFALSGNTSINKVEDLIYKKITGDRHSSFEEMLEQKGIRGFIRIKQTKSKEESIALLKSGEFVAMIAPKEVGFYLAEKFNVKVKIIAEAEQKSPVAIAVKKGNLGLLNMLEDALHKLVNEGVIDRLYRERFGSN